MAAARCCASSASATGGTMLRPNLPYGDQRRLEIARALATEPRLLLLDEPTAGMNPRETETLTSLIGRSARAGALVLLIEHDMQVVMGISDRITVLDYGTRIAEGTPAEIQRQPAGHRGLPGHRLRAGAGRPAARAVARARAHRRRHLLRRHPGAARRVALRASRRDRHAHRRQRRGQDDDAAHDPRACVRAAARHRDFDGQRRSHACRRPASCARGIAPVAGGPAHLPAHDRAARTSSSAPSPAPTAHGIAADLERVFDALPAPAASAPARRAARCRAASSRCWPSAGR